MSIRHPAYEQEQANLDQTMKVIEKEMKQLRAEIKDATDDYVDQIVNAAKVRTLHQLEMSQRKPYFGRIDFMHDETYEKESVYIGKRGIIEGDTVSTVVVDWRAPIASLYYSGESKDAFYRTPAGIVRGEVQLKRNIAIEDGEIKGIYDGALKETINREIGAPDDFLDEGYIDEFLASSLNENNDSRLKDIVATIQSEQNEIIRAEKDRPIVVQGVAGSGKTTIALHRLSYLIYNYPGTVSSKRFMVFAPNKLFLTYISDVLPELGVEDVQQSTFMEWGAKQMKPFLPKGWRVQDPSKPLAVFFDEKTDPREKQVVSRRLQTKGSLLFRQILDAYLEHVTREKISFKSLRFSYSKTGGVFSLEGGDIKQVFYDEYKTLPYKKRVDALRKHMKQLINKQIFTHLRERKMDLDKKGLLRIEAQTEKVVEHYLKDWPVLDVFESYTKLLTDVQLLVKLAPEGTDEELLADVSQSSAEILAQQRIEVEDIAPLLYLRHLLEGFEEKEKFDHTVVDEAQDLSALEITIIAMMTKNESLTVVGDIAQGIHAYRGLSAWADLLGGVFTKRGAVFYTLEQSYRSTIEIMRWANHVLTQAAIPGVTMAKPVLRHGEEPVLQVFADQSDMYEELVCNVQKLKESGQTSIAIVTKTIEESKKAYKKLQEHLPDAVLLGVKDAEFPGGVTIMPAFLTKGLQFDTVILLEVDERRYSANPQEAKLLYVAMTRPVHKLFVYSSSTPISPLLAGIPKATK